MVSRTLRLTRLMLPALLVLGLAACGGGGGGGGGSSSSSGGSTSTTTTTTTTTSTLAAARTTGDNLLASEVGEIIAAAVQEARARNAPAVIAVTDRVGNVLGIFRMNGAPANVTITSQRGVTTGLENLAVPAEAAAIAKAVTGAYLSSGGNAFTTRTASFIVQQTFPPGIDNSTLGGGPLFGVQFSQLPCSDLNTRFATNNVGPQTLVSATIGPKRSPLGLSADPGGIPLYLGGTLVGAIGVAADGIYGLDANPLDVDSDTDELIAVAGAARFFAPADIRADRITVLGQTLRFTDQGTGALITQPNTAPAFSSLGTVGSLVSVAGYYAAAGGLLDGVAFGTAASGIRQSTSAEFSNSNGFVLVDAANSLRFPIQAGTAPTANPLTAAEVRVILEEALGVALSARAQIRRPLGSFAQVTASVVDTNGMVLGQVRTPDAPVFGTDVSLQKARSAMLFSNTVGVSDLTTASQRTTFTRDYLGAAASFGGVNVLPVGGVGGIEYAFSAKTIGNLGRPFFPDGQTNNRPGPYSLPFDRWSIFSTGLQLDLALPNLAQHLQFVLTGSTDTASVCATTATQFILPQSSPMIPALNRLANGLQPFSGGFPIYRGDGLTLIGGIGISGDGIDQDDLIGFLGLERARQRIGTVAHARTDIRGDQLAPFGVQLRYVGCPPAPFLGSDAQNVCDNVGPTP